MAKEKSKFEFKSGHWEWNNEDDELIFFPSESVKAVESQPTHDKNQHSLAARKRLIFTILTFHDTISELEMSDFEKMTRRRSKQHEVTIIKLRYIMDLVLFLVQEPLPRGFVNFLGSRKVHLWLRALIAYMHFFLKACEELMETVELLHGPLANDREPRYLEIRRELKELRVIVGRQHSNLILSLLGSGGGGSHRSNTSDVQLFELLLQMAVRIVWIALNRHSLSVIEFEMNRIFRSSSYCTRFMKQQPDDLSQNFINSKTQDILYGNGLLGVDSCGNLQPEPIQEHPGLSQNSPVLKDFQESEDKRFLQIGLPGFHTENERLNFLAKCIYASEECLAEEKIEIGILGYNHTAFDVALHYLNNESDTDVRSKLSVEESSTAARRATIDIEVPEESSAASIADEYVSEAAENEEPALN